MVLNRGEAGVKLGRFGRHGVVRVLVWLTENIGCGGKIGGR